MSENNRTYRIRTKINSNDEADRVINVNLNRDYDVFELLSLKIDTSNFYKLHTSNYGCVAGRVLANGNVGVPNAKISVFVSIDSDDANDTVLSELYPYTKTFDKNTKGVRYNLLPDTQVSSCHTPVGTFPSKRMILDDENMVEVYDKYYKFTTRSNDAGDYMIFGLPVGDQTIHVDIDLSDIGHLSQKPRDMIYKGYNITQFENANKFKSDTNLDDLTQIISQNSSVYVYPFWGDTNESDVKITRNDIEIQYKFEPTCVFIGSLIVDDTSNGVSKKCIATERMGKMDRLTTGAGTIEMIRKTIDGDVEEVQIQGNQLVDGNGTWCYQIPMNLDYYMTDEYGNFVPSDDKEKGFPTRTRVRFRVSLNDFQSDYMNNHLAKVLVPNNPDTYEDLDYAFGSKTKDDEFGTQSFRDLFYNNLYTVKQYIPRVQKGNNNKNRKFTGIKNVNVNEGNNPIPYNNLRVDLTFMFAMQCAILKCIIRLVSFINWFNSKSSKKCAAIGDGVCPDLDGWYFSPGCSEGKLKNTLEVLEKEDGNDSKSVEYQNNNETDTEKDQYCITNKSDYLMQCVEINLAIEYNVMQFDFYNDWINGMLYIPRWFVNIRKKRSYLFGLIKVKAKTEACMEESFNTTRRFVQQCALTYEAESEKSNIYSIATNPIGCGNNTKQKCHKAAGRKHAAIFLSNNKGGGGFVHSETTTKSQKVYYFKPCEWLSTGVHCNLFATDIVLLGSLNECDEQGIPQAFKELPSSTYFMPTNLAATNLDTSTFMYNGEGNGYKCTASHTTQEEIKTAQDKGEEETFETYKTWSKNADYYDAEIDDKKEYAVTESAGIDWGYRGPRQGKDNLSELYLPGGHFLGIGCFNSAVNIKSCVNLIRICEIGAVMSQRQPIPQQSTSEIKYSYLIPNGLISLDEINDSNFRSMFATMNSNGLKTKRDESTQYLKYDLRYLNPNGFGGELRGKLFNEKNEPVASYNVNYQYDDALGNNKEASAHIRTLESVNKDYYYFRMGLDGTETDVAKKKYLWSDSTGTTVAMPVYNNSFYFYFGLSDGNTAIDRFFNDFYASCETNGEDANYFTINVDTPSSCSGNGSVVSVDIINADGPYKISIMDNDTNKLVPLEMNGSVINRTNKSIYSTAIEHDYSSFTITNLPSGTYKITLSTDELGDASTNFKITDATIDAIENLLFGVKNFKKGMSQDITTNWYSDANTSRGYYNISSWRGIDALCLFNDEKYILYNITNSRKDNELQALIKDDLDGLTRVSSGYVVANSNNIFLPCWKGNSKYKLYVFYTCTGSTDSLLKTALVDNGTTVTMPTQLDILFFDNSLSYVNDIKSLGDEWVGQILRNSKFTEKQKWCLKKALYFRNSLYDGNRSNSINITITGTSLKPTVIGNPERIYISDDGDEDEDNAYSAIEVSSSRVDSTVYNSESDWHVSIENMLLPTSYLDANGKVVQYGNDGYCKNTTDNNHTYGYYKMATTPKTPYKVSLNGSEISALLPSIYRPFYVNAVKLIYPTDSVSSAKINYTAIGALCIVNPILYNKKFDSITIDNNVVEVSGRQDNGGRNFTFTVAKNEGTVAEGIVSFTYSVDEGAAVNYNGNTYSNSISRKFPDLSDSDDDFTYDNRIRFFTCEDKSGNDNADAYVQFIVKGNVTSDYVTTTDCFNGIFGTENYILKDVSDKFTLAELKNQGKSSLAEAFKYQVETTVGKSVIAISDSWTELASSDDEENRKMYPVNDGKADRQKMWLSVTPDNSCTTIVKLYRK
jgi:hypothetical protein